MEQISHSHLFFGGHFPFLGISEKVWDVFSQDFGSLSHSHVFSWAMALASCPRCRISQKYLLSMEQNVNSLFTYLALSWKKKKKLTKKSWVLDKAFQAPAQPNGKSPWVIHTLAYIATVFSSLPGLSHHPVDLRGRLFAHASHLLVPWAGVGACVFASPLGADFFKPR